MDPCIPKSAGVGPGNYIVLGLSLMRLADLTSVAYSYNPSMNVELGVDVVLCFV